MTFSNSNLPPEQYEVLPTLCLFLFCYANSVLHLHTVVLIAVDPSRSVPFEVGTKYVLKCGAGNFQTSYYLVLN